jgi:hypothetical protein
MRARVTPTPTRRARAECWWDQLILDVLVCNAFGIWLGARFLKWWQIRVRLPLSPLCHGARAPSPTCCAQPYDWHSWKDLRTTWDMACRTVRQFTTPGTRRRRRCARLATIATRRCAERWTEIDWAESPTISRYVAVTVAAGCLMLQARVHARARGAVAARSASPVLARPQALNAFFLKTILWVPPGQFVSDSAAAARRLTRAPVHRELAQQLAAHAVVPHGAPLHPPGAPRELVTAPHRRSPCDGTPRRSSCSAPTRSASASVSPALLPSVAGADGRSRALAGSQAWVCAAILITELLVILKLGRGEFSKEMPERVAAGARRSRACLTRAHAPGCRCAGLALFGVAWLVFSAALVLRIKSRGHEKSH